MPHSLSYLFKVIGGILFVAVAGYGWWSKSTYKAASDIDSVHTVCKFADTDTHECECNQISEPEKKLFKALIVKRVDGHRLEKWNAGYTYYVWRGPEDQVVNVVSFDHATCEKLRIDMGYAQ